MNENKRGVGVAFYVSEGISFNKVKGLTSDKMRILIIWCENSIEKKFPFVVSNIQLKVSWSITSVSVPSWKYSLEICTLYVETWKLMCLSRQVKIESTRITKSSQSTKDFLFTNFYSLVMVHHNSISDLEAVEIETHFLSEDKILLKKQNFDFRDN